MYFRKKQSEGRIYLQIVESERRGAAVRQRVIATLGRLDELQASGQLERFIRSGARFCEKAMALSAHLSGDAPAISVTRIGPPLLFERLWEETGYKSAIAHFAAQSGHGFALERAVFLTVLHRLMRGGSDLSADRWKEDYRIEGADGIALHQLYRTMAWLGEELSQGPEQDGATLGPRCRKDAIEEHLFAASRDLLSRLDLVFMDTTSLYFEGKGGETLGQYGFSKDHRPDCKQMILAVVIDGEGHPVCSEMWPGNTADVTAVLPVIDRLRKRFAIGQVCVVADRGMISDETIAGLEARGLSYILGVRERSTKIVRELVLADKAPFVPFTKDKRRGPPVDYGAKSVRLAGNRYIVCINHEEAKKDAQAREAILKNLKLELKKGAKALVGNTGYRRFLKTEGKGFAIDAARVKEDAKFDGIFVLRTNTNLDPLQAMLRYKQLWTVEQTFRTEKHLFATRPIFHQRDETIRGHVFCSFLALALKTALDEKIAAMGETFSWPELLADLDSLTETEIAHEGKRLLLRSAPRRGASLALRAAGIALPPTLRAVDAA